MPQTSDPDVALVKSAVDSLRSGDADKATRVQATISDPVARKLVEWIILRSDHNGAGSARYAAFIAANPNWPSLAMFRRRAEALRLVLARALLAQGDSAGARAQVREAWRNDPMPAELEKQLLESYSEFLSRADHRATSSYRLVGDTEHLLKSLHSGIGG